MIRKPRELKTTKMLPKTSTYRHGQNVDNI